MNGLFKTIFWLKLSPQRLCLQRDLNKEESSQYHWETAFSRPFFGIKLSYWLNASLSPWRPEQQDSLPAGFLSKVLPGVGDLPTPLLVVVMYLPWGYLLTYLLTTGGVDLPTPGGRWYTFLLTPWCVDLTTPGVMYLTPHPSGWLTYPRGNLSTLLGVIDLHRGSYLPPIPQ